MRRGILALVIVVGVVGASTAALWWLNVRDESTTTTQATPTPASIATGAYLARIGNCAGCHTRRGGAPFAGGRGIPTPFGTVYASNLTPDDDTGLGRWTRDDFWRAMHNGRSRDGRLLYPAFPYPHYTEVLREDVDALFDYLRSVPPARERRRAHELRFPYDTQLALAVWRALYFRPGVYEPDRARPADWNRGAYLVRGLGHCGACHAARNPLGASPDSDTLGGGLIPMQGWYAPSLASKREAGVQDWPSGSVVALLTTGVTPRASVLGPMAEVVYASTQHLTLQDATAIATFLKSLPDPSIDTPRAAPAEPTPQQMERGRAIYDDRCAGCHGANGEGWPGQYPPLAGNRAVLLDNAANPIRAVLSGGFSPGTAGNPRPYGMPAFAPFLNDDETASVVSYVRNAWGNRASAVADWQVARLARGAVRE